MTPRFTAEDLGFPNEVVSGVVRISLSPVASSPEDAAKVDSFLVSAVLRIINGKPMPIHTVSRCFERTFKLPFRAFRQPSFVTFLEEHPQFQIFDAYVAPSGDWAGFPPPCGAGPRYYAMCDAIEEQDVVVWRIREELSSLDMAYGGLVSNSGKLQAFLADSNAIKDATNALTFKVVCQTPQGVELPILIEPRGAMTADADEDVAVARKALTRIVEREVAILRKTDETIGLEMADHKRQIATLRMRMEQELVRLEAMYADAYSMVPFQGTMGYLAPSYVNYARPETTPRAQGGKARSSSQQRAPSQQRAQSPVRSEAPREPKPASREASQAKSKSPARGASQTREASAASSGYNIPQSSPRFAMRGPPMHMPAPYY